MLSTDRKYSASDILSPLINKKLSDLVPFRQRYCQWAISVTTCFFIVVLSQKIPAQIIDNRLGNAFKDEMYFSQQFLWLNKVKTISGIILISFLYLVVF